MEFAPPDLPGLLERARGGDADAFGELCRAQETRLLRQAIALCGDTTLAEELAQDTLVEAWRCLGRYNGRCQLFTWLCAILLNRYRNAVRTRRLTPFSALAESGRHAFQDCLDSLKDQRALPDRAAELREQTMLMRKCIQALPVKQQQVIYLRFYVDDSLEGIATALGCSVGTVKSRLFHALEKLRGMSAIRAQFEQVRAKTGNV